MPAHPFGCLRLQKKYQANKDLKFHLHTRKKHPTRSFMCRKMPLLNIMHRRILVGEKRDWYLHSRHRRDQP